jgi:hypothetical protein
LHSCVSLDINKHLFLVDHNHFYKYTRAIDNEKSETQKYAN